MRDIAAKKVARRAPNWEAILRQEREAREAIITDLRKRLVQEQEMTVTLSRRLEELLLRRALRRRFRLRQQQRDRQGPEH